MTGDRSGMNGNRLIVELSFLTTDEGGRSSAANLADGRYRPLVLLGSHHELLQMPTTEAEAEKIGLFGVVFYGGPPAVAPGTTATAELSVPIYDQGYDRINQTRRFTLLEGRRIVGHGRVRGIGKE